ncbi:hypothetical protein ABPG72_004245 [Tetrahymena utriculariae]
MKGSVFAILVALCLFQISFGYKTNQQVSICVQSQCLAKYGCSGKIDEYACKIATNAYNKYLQQPECVQFLAQYQSAPQQNEFPMRLWVPCRSIAYNVYYQSLTYEEFLDCQDVCIGQDY